jgi:Prp8 binding protein
MNENIIPRYNSNQVEEYTSTNLIQQHQPEIMRKEQKTKRKALEENLNQLSIEDQKNLLAIKSKEQLTQAKDIYDDRKLYSPNLKLTGHQDEVYSLDFSPNGSFLVSAGKDRHILLWDLYDDCRNKGFNTESKNAVLQVKFSGDGDKIFAGSVDQCVHAIDMETMTRFKKFRGHKDLITGIDSSKRGHDFILTTSNDSSLRAWDLRQKENVFCVQDDYPLLCVSILNNNHIHCFTGGLDNTIKKWDLRNNSAPLMVLEGHTDSVTGIAINKEDTQLLSNSMDNTVRTWNVKPFCLDDNRCNKVYTGHSHGYEKNLIRCDWSRNHKLIASGSSDNHLYVWNANNRQIKMKLGGHQSCINDVKFSPTNNLIASCSNDRTVILTEFNL